MGSIPVAGAKKDLNRFFGLGLFAFARVNRTHLQNALRFGLGAHFQLKPIGACSYEAR